MTRRKRVGAFTRGAKPSQHVECKADAAHPTPHARVDLRDAHAVRRELASLYRDMRAQVIDTQHGTRMAYVLDLIRKAHETGLLQDRLEALERILDHR